MISNLHCHQGLANHRGLAHSANLLSIEGEVVILILVGNFGSKNSLQLWQRLTDLTEGCASSSKVVLNKVEVQVDARRIEHRIFSVGLGVKCSLALDWRAYGGGDW